MANFVTVGRRLIPREHIAFVEPCDPNANSKFQTSRDFKGRVVMVNRVATNPAIQFRVETFVPADGFAPAKAFATRLLWCDLDGNDQSKLLLSEPETVLAFAVRGDADPHAPLQEAGRRPNRRKQAPAAAAPTLEQ